MPRLNLLVAAAVALLVSAAPAFAGTAETAFLAKVAGTWTGTGQMSGAETGPIACKLVFKTSGAKLTYSGRCNVQDLGAQTFSGSITYNDAAKRYEARSGVTTATGTKNGSAVVFVTKAKTIAGSVTSTMSIAASRISVDFSIIAARTNDKSGSHITFSKS